MNLHTTQPQDQDHLTHYPDDVLTDYSIDKLLKGHVRKGRLKGIRYILMQGFRRKIRICCSYETFWSELQTPEFLQYIVNIADQRNWKTILLTRDDFYGEAMEAINIFQSKHNYALGRRGIYICSPEAWNEDW